MKGRDSIVIEEYLQLIYQWHLRGESIKAAAIVEQVQVTAPTVHSTLRRMQRADLIDIQEKKEIYLTETGEKKAADIVLRHRLAEYFLYNTLKISWHEVHKHAHILEHGLTPTVVEKLSEFLDFPEACPHGSPMPNAKTPSPDNRFSLEQAEIGMDLEIVGIDESLEDSEDLLKHLHDHGVVPGGVHRVVQRLEVTQSLTLESSAGQILLPFEIAKKIKAIQAQS